MKFLVSPFLLSSFFLLAVATYPGGKIIQPAPVQIHTGLKQIPDDDHPYQAPGPNDLRGPCPGLNTLANHGYLPRNGIATFEDIVNAVGEGFNMEHDLASGLAAFAVLSRGNTYTNQVSIGGPTDKIPALPGNIDGNYTKGLATHGRFEGDVSMTRRDAAVGDSVHLDPELFQQLLDNVALYGNDSDVTGPKSVVSYKAMQEFKYERYLDSVANDPVLEYHYGRFILSYGEASFTLNFFANGTDGVLSTDTLKSFFQNHTFPANWHRRSTPGSIDLIGDGVARVLSAHPEAVPGMNINGTFVPEPTDDPCGLYKDIGVNTVPAVLVTTTGDLKTNVDFLLQTIHNLFPKCTFKLPVGAAEDYDYSNGSQNPTKMPDHKDPSGPDTPYVPSGGDKKPNHGVPSGPDTPYVPSDGGKTPDHKDPSGPDTPYVPSGGGKTPDHKDPSGPDTPYVASGAASVAGALVGDISSSSDSGFSKWAPIVIGLLSANLVVGIVLVAMAVLRYIRRGGREASSSRSVSTAYAPVREKDNDTFRYSGEGSYRDDNRPYSEQ